MDLENLNMAYNIKSKVDRLKLAADKLEKPDCRIVVKGYHGDDGISLGDEFIPEVRRMIFDFIDALMETAKTL